MATSIRQLGSEDWECQLPADYDFCRRMTNIALINGDDVWLEINQGLVALFRLRTGAPIIALLEINVNYQLGSLVDVRLLLVGRSGNFEGRHRLHELLDHRQLLGHHF